MTNYKCPHCRFVTASDVEEKNDEATSRLIDFLGELTKKKGVVLEVETCIVCENCEKIFNAEQNRNVADVIQLRKDNVHNDNI